MKAQTKVAKVAKATSTGIGTLPLVAFDCSEEVEFVWGAKFVDG